MNTITVDITEAADILKVHPNTVQDLISKGFLPAAKIGRAYVILVRDLVAYIEAQVVHQTAIRMGAPGRVPGVRRVSRLGPPGQGKR